jgi:translation initiation factor 2B subunit (eIF-2B alpha/beta/delta family)
MNIDAIISDNYSGSMTILQRLIDTIEKELKSAAETADLDIESLCDQISDAIKEIVKEQPNMANIRKYGFSFSGHFRKLLAQKVDRGEIIDDLLGMIKQIREEVRENLKTIAHHLSKIITLTPRVMTISNSTIIRSAFDVLIEKEKKFEVTCLKSHPPDEGVALAEHLARQGAKVRIAADSQAALFMNEVNFVLIGADRILENEIINKSGTLQLCLTARHYNIPVYLAVETAKILLEQDRAVKFKHRDPKEIYYNAENGILVDNYYFERVPLEYIDKIICEEGIFASEEFKKWYLKG